MPAALLPILSLFMGKDYSFRLERKMRLTRLEENTWLNFLFFNSQVYSDGIIQPSLDQVHLDLAGVQTEAIAVGLLRVGHAGQYGATPHPSVHLPSRRAERGRG